ncbi:MAG: hypothetical protein GTN62_01650 [Gemmatimonadales bacterium]|nr:hypothetical protein [Gemmatimonadales bacterium]NIN48807.1 hypothetical protein [Gemmatimonadales bacterium]NIP06271.1 hypothetical protein [Gemmatimonadales bacterium]NIR02679.1 hypothetical protein [Gemmatimonadales bacterium]NIS66329.1 hypothetical protein [Gemmatimonadales bacterium]
MTLGQFSTAVGAPRRWVQNALAVLRLPARYTVTGARELALARAINAACGTPLVDAYPLAQGALLAWPEQRMWERVGPEATVTLAVDLERFLSSFLVRLSLSRTAYEERKRGRPRKRRGRGLAGAREHGVDIGLLESSLRRSPEERLRRLDEDLAFLRSARVVGA